jgi:hypothetical protein
MNEKKKKYTMSKRTFSESSGYGYINKFNKLYCDEIKPFKKDYVNLHTHLDVHTVKVDTLETDEIKPYTNTNIIQILGANLNKDHLDFISKLDINDTTTNPNEFDTLYTDNINGKTTGTELQLLNEVINNSHIQKLKSIDQTLGTSSSPTFRSVNCQTLKIEDDSASGYPLYKFEVNGTDDMEITVQPDSGSGEKTLLTLQSDPARIRIGNHLFYEDTNKFFNIENGQGIKQLQIHESAHISLSANTLLDVQGDSKVYGGAPEVVRGHITFNHNPIPNEIQTIKSKNLTAEWDPQYGSTIIIHPSFTMLADDQLFVSVESEFPYVCYKRRQDGQNQYWIAIYNLQTRERVGQDSEEYFRIYCKVCRYGD